jgi:flagellar hook assembly protein FlgD
MSSCARRIVPRYLESVNCAIAFRRGLSLPLLLSLLLPTRPADAQTFVQLTDLGSSLGPRLTIAVTRARLNRRLFGAIGTNVTFIDQGVVYEFASDPEWGRVLVGRKDEWIHEYDNTTGPGGKLLQPLGIEISARKFVYAADPAKGMILVTQFSPGAKNLVTPGAWSSSQFPRPVDVAWDGRTTPLTADFLYVLDDSLSRVSYWDRPTLLWSYGAPGAGVGQFVRPSGICVGKAAAANGGTQFTTYFYVVDRGSRRVVWLNRGANGPSWLSSATLPDWDPTGCAVDHFGNLYVVDQLNHRLHKFTYSLTLLATYGTYGKGPNNLNTFAWPHAISVPCGLKVVNSQTVWYCEGRVITAEQWSDSSGAVEHYLGMDGSVTAQPQTDQYGDAWFSYRTTDHGYHTFTVFDVSGNTVRRVPPMGIFPPGTRTWLWDGLRDNGTPAPSGTYWMQVTATSVYGCGQTWCGKGLSTQTFYHVMGSGCGSGPCSPPIEPSDSASEPDALFLRQRVFPAGRALARISSLAASAPDARPTTATGTLTELVRQYGVRGLTFGVPRGASAGAVAIRVYSVAGRPIRTLVNQVVEPGYYEVAWDGLDDRGQAAAPGVYFAVLTAGGQRVVQRLILRQGP